jgi:uncharacterized protein
MNETQDAWNRAEQACVAFAGQDFVASGPLADVAGKAKQIADTDETAMIIIFDALTSQPIEVDFRGTPEEVVSRLAATSSAASAADTAVAEAPAEPGAARAPGRPKLGVVAREVTLLPRHWDWLNEQPGGASVTLRKLVEEARRSTQGEVQKRRERESCYRFMNMMAGNEPGYEEALRALYAGEQERFEGLTDCWPPDVRDHARRLAGPTFG